MKISSNTGDFKSLGDANSNAGSKEWTLPAAWALVMSLWTTFPQPSANDSNQRLNQCKKRQKKDKLGAPWSVHDKLKSPAPTLASAKGGL
jgi:hypothetical protein